MDISVIVPTRDRLQKLASLLECLGDQRTTRSFEVVVVDDGSNPPLRLAPNGLDCRVLRLEREERSAARNAGAREARGRLLVFLDDDLSFRSDLLEQHWRAFQEWPSALLVGAVHLPDSVEDTPFGRFRSRLERRNVPTKRGPVASRSFCTAQNLAVARRTLEDVGGFDPLMVSAEDQDLALRHTASGGRVVFVPEALVLHHDDALDPRSYGKRVEWGAAHLGPFLRRHPELSDNVERERVNGPLQASREPLDLTLRKIAKALLASDVGTEALVRLAEGAEIVAPRGRALQRLYEIVVGVYLLRGHRRRRTLEVGTI